jgi:hypothetical protein
VASSPKPADRVFLNIPYDEKFESLFLAFISGICAFGFVPRATLEIATSSRRLDRILDLIHECRYSIHDLSRVELDGKSPRTPRFNMPFELGLSVAHEKSRPGKNHRWFVCESRRFRLAKSLSDLNGTDPFIHDGTVAGLFRELCSMFRRPGRQPTVQQMWRIYRKLRKALPPVLAQAGSDSLFTARVFGDVSAMAADFANKIVS